MGVEDLSLTPIMNLEGERPSLEPVPFILRYLPPFLARTQYLKAP